MLIYVEPSSSGRDAALAAAASLARHLTIDVAMLVRDDERSRAAAATATCSICVTRRCVLHGLDIRTETVPRHAQQT